MMFEDQRRVFTYLNTDLMTVQQGRLEPPITYIAAPSEGRADTPYTLRQVPQEVTIRNGTRYVLRGTELGRLTAFAPYTNGCDVVYVEDRTALPHLGPKQTTKATRLGATLVEMDVAYICDQETPSGEQRRSDVLPSQSHQRDVPMTDV